MSKKDYRITALKAALLAVLLYWAMPSIDDAFTIPILSYFLKLPLLLVALAYIGDIG